MDSLKFFWHFNVMNPYTHLIKLLHVMRRLTWTATQMEMIVFKMMCIIPAAACMTDERDKKNAHVLAQWEWERALDTVWWTTCPSHPSVCLKYSHQTCVCVLKNESWRAFRVCIDPASGSVSFSHCGHWIGQKFNTKKSAAHPVLTKAICNIDLSGLPTKPAAVFTI